MNQTEKNFNAKPQIIQQNINTAQLIKMAFNVICKTKCSNPFFKVALNKSIAIFLSFLVLKFIVSIVFYVQMYDLYSSNSSLKVNYSKLCVHQTRTERTLGTYTYWTSYQALSVANSAQYKIYFIPTICQYTYNAVLHVTTC